MRVLVIEPLEPLVLSRNPLVSQEFILGFHSVLPIPSPTTIAGLLGSALGVTLGWEGSIDHLQLLKRLLEKIEERGCVKPIKGPILWFKGLSDEPYVCLGNIYAPRSVIKVENVGFDVRVYLDGGCDKCVEAVVEERVGVKLVRGYMGRGEKIADKGYMYRYSTLTYKVAGSGRTVTPTLLYTVNCKVDIERGVYRVGGEGRVAFTIMANTQDLPKSVVEALKSVENPLELKSEGLHLALTQIPLIPLAKEYIQLTLDIAKPNVKGLEFVKSIKGIIPSGYQRKLKGKVERLNLGYSETVKARRPQILALPIGTIVETRIPESVEGVIEILWGLGFASLLKLK